MSTGPKTENRGGARPNSGPKKQTLSVRQVQEMLDKAKEWAERTGKTLDDILLSFIYDDSLAAKDRTACIKLFKDRTMAPISEGGDTDKELGPAVYLPAQRPQLEAVKVEQTKVA